MADAQKKKKLLEFLSEMECAAEKGDEKKVIEINQKEFSPEYRIVFPNALKANSPDEEESLWFDRARNNLIYYASDMFKSVPRQRKECLETAKGYISKIKAKK